MSIKQFSLLIERLQLYAQAGAGHPGLAARQKVMLATLARCEQMKTSECTESAWQELMVQLQKDKSSSLGGSHQILTDMRLISERLATADKPQTDAGS